MVSVPLFAQSSGRSSSSTGTSSVGTSSISTGFGDSYQGVENVSETAVGTFIGSGAPSAFVGIDEVYNAGSSNASRVASNRRPTTTTRTTRPITQSRTAARPSATRSNSMGNSNQFVRAVTAIDFDVTPPSLSGLWSTTGSVESGLKRIQGMQDSRVMFKSSPMGTTAVLTGTVASERERKVAQQLLLMEPGVSRVDNLLEIR